ncbi:HAD family hydrolase [Actinomadura sp. ATCC 31491]|uniref:HAD family hydrolase n=1 Tax=Actinomadura luzonensis TaxID=2805427 RepID=A0ABT0FY82_9ACTN|nr:HAD family hydrolase [Actinomadura luzonensis]MCK2217317.1 HAD family hydrolase [Actinomadura luzonensis]
MRPLALFDLDRTLLDLDTALARWAAEFAAGRGLGPEAVALVTALDAELRPDRGRFFAELRRRFGLPEPAEELREAFRRRLPYLAGCYPGVREALAGLRAEGWRVGIVTNGAADRQLGKIRRTGLGELVDGYAISDAEGVRKPAAELFAIAARRCGTGLAAGGWMVGDNPATDVAGARAAGLRSVWIDHGTWPAHANVADHVVGHVLAGVEVVRDACSGGAGRVVT